MFAFFRVDVISVDGSPHDNVVCDGCVLSEMHEDGRGLVDWWFGCVWFSAFQRPCLKVEFSMVFRNEVNWSDVEPYVGHEWVLDVVHVEGMVDGGVVLLAGLVVLMPFCEFGHGKNVMP